MSYLDSAQGVTITQARAIAELDAHGVGDAASVQAFLGEVGNRAEYAAQEVLHWLGY